MSVHEKPLMDDFIPLSVPNMAGNELRYVTDAISNGWVSTAGSYVERFEKEFAAYAKVDAAAAVQSGTAALHLAMLGCGVGSGDLVIAPTLTFIAAINPIRYVGADPVFMDCDDSLCMDTEKLARYLDDECETRGGVPYDKAMDRPVRAIVVVHIFGNGADMERIIDVAGRHNLPVIEDATEAVGTFYTKGRYKGRMCGTIGDYGAYSFNGNKIITTGGGGMLVAGNPEKVRRAKHLSMQAKTDEVYYDHDAIGYNYRMTNVQAAMGVAQLEQLEGFIRIKSVNYRCYNELGIKLLGFSDNVRSNHWFYSYLSDERDGIIKHLAENRVQSRPIWKLIHTLPMYEECRTYGVERAGWYYKRVVNLPCGTGLGMADVERVSGMVMGFGTAHIEPA